MANKAQLIAVRDLILANKERFTYSKWLARGEYSSSEISPTLLLDSNECGTAGCVAGWTCAMLGQTKLNVNTAREALGLSIREADFLFFADDEFGFPKVSVKTASVDVAIERLNYLIEHRSS
jgi:hypothetical protein